MSQTKLTWRMSGKKIAWPDSKGTAAQIWKFENRPGGWVIASRELPSGKVERVRFSAVDSGKNFGALISGKLWHGELQAKRRGGAGAGAADSDLTAQFPGKVRKVLVQDGTTVVQGQPLLLVEAMKMEFSIKAPSDGVLKKVLVEEGQQITPGQLFVEFVPSATPSEA